MTKTFGQKLSDLRKKHSLTQPMLADKLNVSQSTITMWENDRRAIGKEDLAAVATFFGVSADYLLGIQDKIKTVPVPSLSAKVNVYGSIRAGSPTFAQQEIIGNVSVSDKVEKRYGKENLFALMVKGNSMNLKVLPGYVAIFAKDVEIDNGDTVAVLIDGEDATIKNYRETSVAIMFEPQSSDPTFQPIVFPKSGVQDFRILGKMVYVVSGDYI
ncbi:XRE family transcriptional regulator [Liquorilactobacillus mali]|uniref:LexA family protein n=1 Tax=Liquorilactobacillus mali TaxID=1618 RepID=UPI002655B2EB|nr:XRE family transcriptional regulator [Liquorilactobacillus mali]MDN7144406.1 XRE family transcriptional regulator [Liquorilactobacillus mali]